MTITKPGVCLNCRHSRDDHPDAKRCTFGSGYRQCPCAFWHTCTHPHVFRELISPVDRSERCTRCDAEMADIPRDQVGYASPEPMPTPNEHPAVWDLVKVDIDERDAAGVRTYGTRLQPHNGRDALKDAYQESLDQTVYLRQLLYERDGK